MGEDVKKLYFDNFSFSGLTLKQLSYLGWCLKSLGWCALMPRGKIFVMLKSLFEINFFKSLGQRLMTLKQCECEIL